MKCFPCFEREPEGNSEMVSLCNDQNLDTQNHLCDHNQKVKKKKKDLHHNAQRPTIEIATLHVNRFKMDESIQFHSF